MKYTIDLPEPLAERLRRFASEQRQTPEEVIATMIDRDLPSAESIQEDSDGEVSDIAQGINPLAEFFGRYIADVSDITFRHDIYLAEEALATHEGEDKADE
jgi:hypothetical protein